MNLSAKQMPGSASDQRLSVSGVLLCCNCERFVAEAVQSTLAQDCDPMEIVISDDASDDGTYEIVQREVARYAGPHHVRISRRSVNTGSKSAHLNEIFPTLTSDVIVSFDDDDVSEPSRVSRLVAAFRADARIQAVYSSFSQIDGSGRQAGRSKVPHPPPGRDSRSWFARVDSFAAGTTLAIRKEVVEKFGAIDPRINEDIVLPFRASLLGEVAFIDAPLVKARRRADSLTFDLERYRSIENYRARMQSGIEGARRNRASRLADIRTAIDVMPERADEFRALERIVSASMAEVEISGDLLSPSFQRRCAALFKLSRLEAFRGELAQDACLALIPGLYLRYKRRRLEQRVR